MKASLNAMIFICYFKAQLASSKSEKKKKRFVWLSKNVRSSRLLNGLVQSINLTLYVHIISL